MGSALSIEDYRLSGMINAYAKKFKQSYHYISDSNGYWRYLRLYDLLKRADEKRIQILIHPGWWQKTVMPPRKRVIRCIEERSKCTLETYDAILKLVSHKEFNDFKYNNHKNGSSIIFDLKGTWSGKNVLSL